MNRYSWHTTTEKASGGWYKCTAIVVFPGNTLKFNTYPFYKPNLKGSHTHNHYRNVLERKLNKSKDSRKRCHNHLNKGYDYKFVTGW